MTEKMDKYLLTPEEITDSIDKIPVSEYAKILEVTKDEYQYKIRIKYMEIEKILESQLNKAYPLIREEVRKETAEDIKFILLNYSDWTPCEQPISTFSIKYCKECDYYETCNNRLKATELKKKYGIEGK
jgi:hypothetical protein